MSAKSRDSADSLDSEIVSDLSDEVKLRWIQFISVKLTVAPPAGDSKKRSELFLAHLPAVNHTIEVTRRTAVVHRHFSAARPVGHFDQSKMMLHAHRQPAAAACW